MLTDFRSTARPEDQLVLVLVVTPASQRDVLHRRQSTEGVRHHMMELQEGPLLASMTVPPDEGAPAPITAPHGTLDLARDVTRRSAARGPIRPGADNARTLRLRCRGELRLLDLLEEKRQGALDDEAGIALRDLTAQEVLEAAQPVVTFLAERELNPVPVRRGGLDDRTLRRRRQRPFGWRGRGRHGLRRGRRHGRRRLGRRGSGQLPD